MKNYSKGISLIETVVMIGVFALIMIAISAFVLSSYKSYSYNFNQAAAITEARKGTEVMVKEIREARTGEDGSYPLAEANDFQLFFYSDIDKDDVLELIHYWLDGTNFKKGVIEPDENEEYLEANETIVTLSQYVRNGSTAVFTYYNASYPINMTNNPLPYEQVNIDDIRLIDIYLEVNVDLTRAPNSYILHSMAQIRTLKDNL